jgi:peptidoglycan/xylan/chitin deacetylase (PgdA/CDA1 family)
MSLRSQLGLIRRSILNASHRRLVALGHHGPIVTFTFDDFPRTALTAGAPILERFGARATYYVAMSLMNKRNELGEQFHHEDLVSLLARGHEIASHTFSHLSARRPTYDVFKRDQARGETALCEILGIRASGNFAYPYGEATLEAKRKLGPELLSSRGTCGGLNGPKVDLNLLRANHLYGDVGQAKAAQQLILENEKKKSWLIFYTHDVAPDPSPYGCTPELIEAVCSFAAARRARFMTVAQVIKQLVPQVSPQAPTLSNRSVEQTSCTSGSASQEQDRTVLHHA